MSLDKDKLAKALAAYEDHDGGVYGGIEAAIEAYLEDMFKPGEMIVGEAVQPARDYRKELWIEIVCSKSTLVANQTLAEFDKTFPKDPS
jgi:hypothetical protein